MMRHREYTLYVALTLAAFALLGAADHPVCLSTTEESLAPQIVFDRDVLLLIKEEALAPLHRLSGYDESGYQIMANGVVVSVPRTRSGDVLRSLRNKLRPRNFMVFLVEINEALKIDKIGVIKGVDQYDILRIMQTNGEDDDVSHEEIVDKLKEWERSSPFVILGAENDWIEIEFKILPRDLKLFAEDVYELSPDAVDEGAGSLAELIKGIGTTKRLMLLWY